MIAVVAGSTGLTGSLLLSRLLNDSRFSKVISVSRRKPEISSPKLVEVIISDLSDIPSRKVELKGDIYFCCLGTTMKDAGSRENFLRVDQVAVLEFATLAEHSNAKAFVVISASGASIRSPLFYSRVKGEVEESLKKMKFQRLVMFRPGLLMGQRKAFRLGEKMAVTTATVIRKVLPHLITSRLMTTANRLAERMLEESLNKSPGIVTIESRDI